MDLLLIIVFPLLSLPHVMSSTPLVLLIWRSSFDAGVMQGYCSTDVVIDPVLPVLRSQIRCSMAALMQGKERGGDAR